MISNRDNLTFIRRYRSERLIAPRFPSTLIESRQEERNPMKAVAGWIAITIWSSSYLYHHHIVACLLIFLEKCLIFPVFQINPSVNRQAAVTFGGALIFAARRPLLQPATNICIKWSGSNTNPSVTFVSLFDVVRKYISTLVHMGTH